MEVPQGTFALARPDGGGRAPLRAWDAADELALAHLAGRDLPPAGASVVLVGDAWGALACALARWRPTVVVDSHLAGRTVAANLDRNGIDPATVAIVDPLAPLPDRVDVAVVKVPKAGALLDHHLARLAPRLAPDATVVGAGMTRHVHTSTIDAFARWIGPTPTSRAVRKARLLLATVDPTLTADPATGPGRASPWPRTVTVAVPDGAPLAMTAHAGVFSAERLDAGTALLLGALPEPGAHAHAVDLGCGTGVVGTVLARRDPDLAVTLVDDSALAVASARATWAASHGERPATFVHGDGLLDPAPIAADLVVVNPPFHRDHSVGDATAWRLFREAREQLPPGGELLVVGNRHLAHHAKLARLFGKDHVEVAASDPSYVVLRALR